MFSINSWRLVPLPDDESHLSRFEQRSKVLHLHLGKLHIPISPFDNRGASRFRNRRLIQQEWRWRNIFTSKITSCSNSQRKELFMNSRLLLQCKKLNGDSRGTKHSRRPVFNVSCNSYSYSLATTIDGWIAIVFDIRRGITWRESKSAHSKRKPTLSPGSNEYQIISYLFQR